MTKVQTILNQIKVILTGTLPNNVPVYDDRVSSFDRDEGTCVLISPDSESTQPHNNIHELSTLLVNIDVEVRTAAWKLEADTYIAAIHPLLMNDATLGSMITRIRRVAKKWDAHEADVTAGVVTLSYHVWYFTQPTQI